MDWIDNRLTIYSDTEADLKGFLLRMSGAEVRIAWATSESVADRIEDLVRHGKTPVEAVMHVSGYQSSVKALEADTHMNKVSNWLEGLRERIDRLERDCNPVFGSPGSKAFSFMHGHPIPQQVRRAGKALGGMPWCLENWGTRYDAIKPEVSEAGWNESLRGHVGVISFITGDRAPDAFIKHIAAEYRGMIFSLVSCDYFQRQAWGSVAYQDDAIDFSNIVGRYHDDMIDDDGGEFSINQQALEKHSTSMAKAIVNKNNGRSR